MEIHGKEDKLISNTNENGCLCTTETLLSSVCYHSCKPGTETALCDLREQSRGVGHGSQLALRSIISVKSLQAICWLKYVHVKHLSKTFEYSQMWGKKIKVCFRVTGKMKKILVISLSDHGMPCYAVKTMDLD